MARTSSLAIESELDTDDYNDLVMTECYKRPSTVKFSAAAKESAIIEDHHHSESSYSKNHTHDLNSNLDTQDNSSNNSTEARRFVKSPHPRGSARFACRPLANNQEFIDAIVDSKVSLENAMSTEQVEQVEQQIPVEPQRTSKEDDPHFQDKTYLHSKSLSQSPPELPPRSSPALSGTSITPSPQLDHAPRPKPRTSKMTPNVATAGNSSEGNSTQRR